MKFLAVLTLNNYSAPSAIDVVGDYAIVVFLVLQNDLNDGEEKKP
jgi:hypothetical protein